MKNVKDEVNRGCGITDVLRAYFAGTGPVFPAPASADIDRLLRSAHEQKFQPMVFEVLSGNPEISEMPEFAQYRRSIRAQVAIQAQKTVAFSALYTAMRDAGLHPLVVKGILCRSVYPNGDMRPSSDEDLYVSDGEFSKSCAFLREYGMQPTEEKDEKTADEIGWRKQGTGLYIELHRRLFRDTGAERDLQRFFNNAFGNPAEYEMPDGTIVLSLMPEDHMLYLILHAFKHFIGRGVGLRQICDMALWASKYNERIDWDRLMNECGTVRADRFAAAVFRIAGEELRIGPELPECMRDLSVDYEPLLSDILDGGVYGGTDAARTHAAAITKGKVSSARNRKRHSVLRNAFPPRKQLISKYPVLKTHPAMLPVIWCKRLAAYRKEMKTGDAGGAVSAIRVAGKRENLLKEYGVL